MSEPKSPHQQGVLLRPNFARCSGMEPAIAGQPDGRAIEEWLSGLGQLRSSAALDRAILDTVHQDVTRSPRSQPVLLLALTLSCVVVGVMGQLQLAQTVPGANLASSNRTEKPLLVPAIQAPAAPVPTLTSPIDRQGPAISQTIAQKPLLAPVRPLDLYRPKAKLALASRGVTASLPHHAAPAADAVPAIRLAALTLPAVATTPGIASPPAAVGTDGEGLPQAAGISAGLPSLQIPSSLAWSGAGLAAAPVKLHERLNGMVNPTGLWARLPQSRDSHPRPIYKRAWFVGMLGVAATGLAVGVTAAVVSSQQAAHGTTGQPITVSLGPT